MKKMNAVISQIAINVLYAMMKLKPFVSVNGQIKAVFLIPKNILKTMKIGIQKLLYAKL